MSLSGCVTDACTGFSAIKVSRKDALTNGTSRQILSHNEYGLKLGCPGFTPKSQSKLPGFSPAFKLPGI